MNVIIAHLRDDISEHASLGAGSTEAEAKRDALAWFFHKPEDVIRKRLENGDATVQYETRELPARFVKLTEAGVPRVLDGKAGMVFEIDEYPEGAKYLHVRDYRFGHTQPRGFQVWTIGLEGVEFI